MPAKTITQVLQETQAITSIDLLVKTCIDLGYRNAKKASGNRAVVITEEPYQTLIDLQKQFESFNPEFSDSGEIKIGNYTIGVEGK